MSQKMNEACKYYLEMELPEKYLVHNFWKVYISVDKGPYMYLDVVIWQFGEWGKPLNQMILYYSI